jgi:hypothetical protein
VTYRRVLDWNDWIYSHLYIHTTRAYRQLQRYRYSTHFQFTVAHALGFSVFTSRILATDISLSVTSNHTWSLLLTVLIPFVAFVLRLPIPKTRLHSIPPLPSSYPGRLASRSSTRLDYCSLLLCPVFCALL